MLKLETIGQSVQGRNLYALKFSSSEFGKDKSKIKVMFQAQQHGNEQSGKDTVEIVNDYRPVVKSITDVQKPAGYLIPKQNKELIEWVGKQALTTTEFKNKKGQKIEQYIVKNIDSIDFERDIIINPIVEAKEFNGNIISSDYFYSNRSIEG